MDKKVYEFISQETNDPIVEWKTCKVSGQPFAIFQSDVKFYDKISPVIGGKRFPVPTPTLCPEEREKRRSVWKNERKLYRGKCALTGENIISLYAPDPAGGKPYTVYSGKARRSDQRDPLSYGRDFTPAESFNQQFSELMHEVPLIATYGKNNENAEYNNIIVDSKNCYLCVSTGSAENCCYTTLAAWISNCYDGFRLIHSENCYEATDSDYCYECCYIQKCVHCDQCRYMKKSTRCKNCRLCIDIHRAEHMILNKQYSKEEYEAIVEKLIHDKKFFDEKYQEFLQLVAKQPVDNGNTGSEHCIGGFITNSQNCVCCFDTIESNNCKYGSGIGLTVSDCYDCGGGDVYQTQLCYEGSVIAVNHHTLFSYSCRDSHDLMYCYDCYNSSNLFGCIALRHKQYCIFNKQYTKEEYEKKVAEIISYMQSTGEWGEYFAPLTCPFGYNESVAQVMSPMSREQAIASGYHRQDNTYDPKPSATIQSIQGKDLPNTIAEVQDDILEKIILCEVTNRPFKIQKSELEFYRKYHLPLPRRHPDVRHQDRMDGRQPRGLHLRKCASCAVETLSVYSLERPEIVYCEECYKKIVYA